MSGQARERIIELAMSYLAIVGTAVQALPDTEIPEASALVAAIKEAPDVTGYCLPQDVSPAVQNVVAAIETVRERIAHDGEDGQAALDLLVRTLGEAWRPPSVA